MLRSSASIRPSVSKRSGLMLAVLFFVALPFVASTIGCQTKSEPVVTATGQVTADDEPLSGAVVTFEPIHPTTGPNASVPVFNGKFDLAANAGLHGGDYRVRIAMVPAEIRRGIPTDQVGWMPPDDAVIDPAFDADSNLSCTLKPDQDNVLSFQVEFL